MSAKNNPENWSIDNRKIELFFSEVLKKHLLPNAHHKSVFALGPAAAKKFSYADVDLADTFDVYRNSQYSYGGKYLFIHYTTIKNLINILREKKLRLYDFNGMDDKDEFCGAYTILGKPAEEYFSKRIKSKVHCFSMCEYHDERRQKDLSLWREYSDDGVGAAIILKFNQESSNNWVHLILSRVYYKQKDLGSLQRTLLAYNKFKGKYHFNIGNFEELLYRLFIFHKQPIYSHEKEVRLIYTEGFKMYDEFKAKLDINKSNRPTSFMELDIEWKAPDWLLKISEKAGHIRPYITIEEIVLGYRLSRSEKVNIIEVIRPLISGYDTKPRVRESNLSPFFHFE